MSMKTITINSEEEKKVKKELEERQDTEGLRLKRFLNMPDLSRTEGSPLKEIVDRASKVKSLEGFDVIEIPEVIPTNIMFDLFNMPPGHPARSPSDTYYVDDNNVLRTHDTVFWYYYLNHPTIKERIAKGESFGAICHGKVYRKDEIDNRHMNVFHQKISKMFCRRLPEQYSAMTSSSDSTIISSHIPTRRLRWRHLSIGNGLR